MNPRYLLLGLLMLLGFGSSLAYAAGCGTLPSGISGLITSCIPVNIVNTQSGATSTGFQQMLSSFPTNALQGNFVIYNSISGALAPAWVESSNTVWVQLGANTIAGSSSANGIWYIGYGSSSTNFFISGNDMNEAPQLSSTYGQYDNGNTVFTFYDNGKGSTLAGWWNQPSGVTATVNDGFAVAVSSSYNWIGIYTTQTFSLPFIAESYLYYDGSTNVPSICTQYAYTAQSKVGSSPGWGTGGSCSVSPTGNGNNAGSMVASANQVFSSIWTSSTQAIDVNYVQQVSQTSTISGTSYIGFGGLGGLTAHSTWIRVREYPPSGVMPSVTYGSPQSLTGLSFSPSSTVSYGTSVSVSMTCIPSSDTCAVQAPLGTNLCTGTGSCTYTIPNYPAAGTYTYYGNDITLGTNVNAVLTVNQATPLLYFPTQCTTGTWAISPCVTTAKIVTVANQLQANFYLNNALITNTYTQATNALAELGSWVYTFNTLGNGNYFASSNSYNFSTYEGVFLKNVSSTGAVQTATANAVRTYKWNTYYPIQLSTQSPSNVLSYSLYSQYYSNSMVLLQANVLNISYIPPANQLSGNYIYTIYQFQTGDSQVPDVIINAYPLNMTDMKGPLTFNGLCATDFQYTPDCAIFPLGANVFTAKPNSWKIGSDVAANQHSNFTGSSYNIEQFSNANLIFNAIISLTYPSPFSTFTMNVLDNPTATNSITLSSYAYTIVNSIATQPASPNNRQLYGINSYDELTNNGLVATHTISATTRINNYSIPLSLSSTIPPYNSYNVYMPNSVYQNAIVNLINQSFYSTASGYRAVANNYYNAFYSYPSYPTDNIYFVGNTSGGYSSATVTYCNSYAYGDFVQVLYGVKGSQTQVQLYQMNNFPFLLPLLTGGSYQFIINTQSGAKLYSSAVSVWGSTISIPIGCGGLNQTPVVVPDIVSECSAANYPGNMMNVTCIGYDKNNIIKQWVINFTNQTNSLYSTVLYTKYINSSAFTVNYLYSSNKTSYPVVITGIAPYADPVNSVYVNNIQVGIQAQPVGYYTFALFAIVAILAPLLLAYFKQDLWIVVEIIVISVLQGISTSTGIYLLPFTTVDMAIFYVIGGILLVYDLLIRK